MEIESRKALMIRRCLLLRFGVQFHLLPVKCERTSNLDIQELPDRLHARLWDDLRKPEKGYEVTTGIAISGTIHVTLSRSHLNTARPLGREG
jgi:hypothetical protein